MRRSLVLVLGLVGLGLIGLGLLPPRARSVAPPAAGLQAGFSEADITPAVKPDKPVYLAGFGSNRKATGVHDPLRAMVVVLSDGSRKVALVSVDLVGYFREYVEKVRKRLTGFDLIVISSTHNHEGPDTLGLWGPAPFQSGIDPDYLATVETRIVEAIRSADRARQPVQARLGTVRAPELLHDGRLPIVKHDELVALSFRKNDTGQLAGLVVQWNCHPETLSSSNTLVSSDYVGPTVQWLKKKHRCPVVYLTGTVGGLMTSLHVPIKSKDGKDLADGTFEKTERYGELLAEAADKALTGSKPVNLVPFEVRNRALFLPLSNKLYVVGWQLGALKRPAFLWDGDVAKATPTLKMEAGKTYCIQTEVSYLRLGDLDVACIPGEIYPELVLDKVQDPVDPGADFPDAAIEPAIYKQMPGPHRMIIGLGCDEIGYIIPKRQWDEKPPFCYGLKKAQYGEINSLGPETAPLLCRVFKEMVKGK